MNQIIKSKYLALLAFAPMLATAEEGGSGHYMPGSMSSFVDGVPTEETFIARYNFLLWDAEVEANRTLPIAGLLTAGADITSYANGLTLLWRPSWGSINDRWSYAMSATIPYVDLDVSANVITPLGTVRRSDSISGIGDIVLMPVMLNQNISPDFNINYRLGVYAPTGKYEVGRLANTGKNYWTIEPTVGFMYFGQKNGREASVFFGGDFNFENSETDYQTGTQLHIDGTLAQHLPLWGGLIGIGVNGYWYEQVGSDSGAGATFGDFKARTTGIGPVLSFVSKIADVDIIAELKWLHEFNTKDRPEGDFIWFKLVSKF
ncbi:SphA family protein [Haloferula sp.]|uniref:SphA family protein n=1 Tax=Haloferula sp. TaxID=2497595 RepID=UPI003C794233